MAIEALMLRRRGGDTMLARFAVLTALNLHVERVFSSDVKDEPLKQTEAQAGQVICSPSPARTWAGT